MKKILPILLVVLSLCHPVLISSQSTHSEDMLSSELIQNATIAQKDYLEEEIDQLQKIYFEELDAYRDIQTKYRVARAEYVEYQTLRSIENVIKQSKSAMKQRNKVLQTYLLILKMKLIVSQGVEISEKELLLQRIENNLDFLESFQLKINQASDRTQVNQIADEFEEVRDKLKSDSYHTLVLISLGRLQNIYDKSQIIYDDLKQKIETNKDKINEVTRKRIIQETDFIIDDIDNDLDQAWSNVEFDQDNPANYESLYRSLVTRLDSIYTNLSQLLGYYHELIDFYD